MAHPAKRRGAWAKPLADFVATCLGPALARQGFSGTDIVASWPEIVGERLSAASAPIRVEWPRRPVRGPSASPDPATLVVRVEGAFALDLQHLAPVVIERVNAYYGWRCVGRLVLKQGPVQRKPAPAPAPRALDPSEGMRLARTISGITDDPLREALDRLGRAVLTTTPATPVGQEGGAVPQSQSHPPS